MLLSQEAAPKKKRAPLPGVKEVQKPMDLVKPIAVFPVPGLPDWTVATPDGIWVSNKPKNSISKLDAKTNTVTATFTRIPERGEIQVPVDESLVVEFYNRLA